MKMPNDLSFAVGSLSSGEQAFWKPLLSRKIGMNLGIEYLIRSKLIREFMTLPCSIFVKRDYEKKVVTINKANIQNDKHATLYDVKNWLISECDEEQPIPSIEEFIVRDVDLFCSSHTILKGYTPLYFDCNSIEWRRNRGNNGHPMPDYIYEDYFHKMLNPISHASKREGFLWKAFTTAYIPAIEHIAMEEEEPSYRGWGSSIGRRRKTKSPQPSFLNQQNLIEKNFKNIWLGWLKWKKFMLFNTVPGELIFMREYASLA